MHNYYISMLYADEDKKMQYTIKYGNNTMLVWYFIHNGSRRRVRDLMSKS